MSYLDSLLEIENKIVQGNELEINERVIVISLIEEEKIKIKCSEDTFVYFYTDISGVQDLFDYSNVLGDDYKAAQDHAGVCISIYSNFLALDEGVKLASWLQSAIKFVDCIVLHYLQDILKEVPTPQGDAGKERSRYIQITKNANKAEKAGRIMNNLYGERNKMEHTTKPDPDKPGRHILHPPNYRRVKRNIRNRLPEALENFNDAFKEFYAT